MIKKIYSLIVAVIMAACILSVPVYANDVLTVTAENKEIEIGTQTVSVKINISNNPGIATIGFNVGYDSDVMEIQEWTTTGAIFTEAEIDSNTSKNPFLISAYTGKTNKTANGEFVTLNFAIKPTCGAGTYPITLSRSNLGGALNIDEQDVEYELVSGSVTVKENQEQAVAVTGVTLNKSAISLKEGETETIISNVTPANATNKTIIWTSSNNDVATVSNGIVSALKSGSAVITATTVDGGHIANCTVTVTEKVIDTNAPKITITDIKTMPGKEIQMIVELANNTGFASMGIEVGYNTDVMTLTNVIPNTGVGGIFTPGSSYMRNPFNLGWDSSSNVLYNGDLATLTFSVKENAPDGIYPVTIDYYKGVKGNYIDGDDINYDEDFNAVGFVYVSGKVIVASYIPGDINGDETVNNKDVTYLLRYLAGWDIDGINNDALDIDGNGSVNNKDATILIRYLAGWDVTLH